MTITSLAGAKAQLTKSANSLNEMTTKGKELLERLKTTAEHDTRLTIAQEMLDQIKLLDATQKRLSDNMGSLEGLFAKASAEVAPTDEEIKAFDAYAVTYADAYEDSALVIDLLTIKYEEVIEPDKDEYRSTTSKGENPVIEPRVNQAVPDDNIDDTRVTNATNTTLVEILKGIQLANKVNQTVLQPFKGDRWEFAKFMTMFDEIMGNSDQRDLLKFNYLMSCLEGEPKEFLETYELTDANYLPALEALKQKYGNRKKAVADLLSRLKKEVAKSDSVKDQRKLYDKVKTFTNQMLGVDDSMDNPLTRQLIMEKFKYQIQKDALTRKLKRPDGDWTITEMLADLDTIITRDEELQEVLPARNNDKGSRDSRGKSHNNRFEKNPSEKREGDKKTKRRCLICNEEHYMSECNVKPNPLDRTRAIEVSGRCGQCLRRGHTTSTCNGKVCTKCHQKGHHFANCVNTQNGGKVSTTNPADANASHIKGKPTQKAQDKHKTQARTVAASTKVPRGEGDDVAESDESRDKEAETRTAASTLAPSKGTDQTTTIPTIRVEALNPKAGEWQHITAMIDTGADLTLISKKVAMDWTLPIVEREVFALKNYAGEAKQQEFPLTKMTLRSPETSDEYEVSPYVSEKLVGKIRKTKLPQDDLVYILKNKLTVNSDTFETSVEPDMIIGNDYIPMILTGKIERLPSGMTLLDTLFGNTPLGRSNTTKTVAANDEKYIFSVVSSEIETDDAQMVEEEQRRETTMKGPDEFTGSLEDEKLQMEQETIEHFKENVEKRGKSYYVKLPYKKHREELPDNYAIAEKRLKSVGRQCSTEVLKMVDDVFKDQIDKKILEVVDPDEDTGNRLIHYNPHQPVLTPTKTTTKCRVVVDGSAHFKGKPSLNDQINQGPTILPDLVGLLQRFRSGKVAVTSDAEKAFLQVFLHEDDRDATRLLWVNDVTKEFNTDNIVTYRFTRVLFGRNVSPFLLGATINHHLSTIDNQEMAVEMANNLYVDNLLMTTDDDPKDALQLYTYPKKTFTDMGMNLREFTTNSQILRDMLPEGDASAEESPKIMGIRWDTRSDMLEMNIDLETLKTNSRRTVSSAIACTYDPLGLLAPLLLPLKLFQRELWMEIYNWDTPLNQTHEEQWQKLLDDVNGFKIRVPRNVVNKTNSNIILTFTDASKEAAAFAIYIGNDLGMNLIYAKTKVKPLKEKWTIPKLETQALKMGVTSTLSTIQHLLLGNIKIDACYIFTDSMIALGWVEGATEKKVVGTFVANRIESIYETVEQINELEIPVSFGHVISEENPADLGTRECTKETLNQPMWFEGVIPENETLEQWIQKRKTFQLKDDHHVYSLVRGSGKDQVAVFDCQVTNNWTKMVHTVVIVMKFLKKRLQKGDEPLETKIHGWAKFTTSNEISTDEFQTAKDILIRDQQKLITPQQIKNWSDLRPTKDEKGIIVCVGRMENAELDQETKYPALIQPNSALAKLIILKEHSKFHKSENHTITSIRERYLLPKVRQQVKKVLGKCVPCQRSSKLPYKYPDMAPLPKNRVTKTCPFDRVGIDGFGPIEYMGPDGILKATGIIFVCMVTRATHIEVVTDNSATSFLQAFRRFIAIRGTPSQVLTDNGTNFTLGAKIIKESFETTDLPDEVQKFLRIQGIDWKFITPLSPWKGGMYERMVKTAKQMFMKEKRLQKLTLTELQTVFNEVAAMMNDRPLTYPDNEVGTLNPIRPSDFLTLKLPVTIPWTNLQEATDDYLPSKEAQSEETRIGTIRALEKSMEASESLWKRFSQEYLTELRLQHKNRMDKKRGSATIPKVGQCVLLWEEQPTPRNVWKIAEIKELITSPDGHIREAIVRTVTKKELRKSINHLIPLELDEPTDENGPTIATEPNLTKSNDDENSTKPRYNLRNRKPINYDDDKNVSCSIRSFKILPSNSIMTITMIMLACFFGMSNATETEIAKTTPMKPYCSNHGIRIMGRFESFEACVEDYCTNYHRINWNALNERYDVWIPQEKKIRQHHATIKIYDGEKMKTWELDCQEVQFCETIDCTICWTNILNPECHIWWAIGGLAAAAFIGLLILHSVCFAPIRLAATFILGWKITKILGSCIMATIKELWRRVSCKWTTRTRQRYHRMRMIIVLWLVLMTPLVLGCQQIDVYTQFQKICSQKTTDKCETFTEVTIDLNSAHKEGCIRLEKNGTVIRDIRIRLIEIRQECTKEIVAYSKDVETRIWSSKRCPRMGSCSGDKCKGVNRTSTIPELDHANQYIGNTYCTESCGTWGCGCGWFSSGCIFYRIYAFPRSDQTVDIFRCLDYRPTARFQITSSKLNSKQNEKTTSEVQMPIGQSETWADMTLTIDSIWTPPAPILNTWFIHKDGNVATWPQNHFPALNCDRERLNCTFHESCTCTSTEDDMRCYCDDDDIDGAFSEPRRHLPVREGHWRLETHQDTITANTATATTKITMKILKKWSTTTMVSDDECKANTGKTVGCYACETGATTEINCWTQREDTMAEVQCGNETFVVRCRPEGHRTNLTFFTDNAKFVRSCEISCGGRRDKFEISSTLRYSGSIWTSIYRLIKGDTTVYNEINLPDLGNVFECYISYIKTMIIVMTMVAATFLLTYTIITQTGIKTQKQQLRATMAYQNRDNRENQDVINTITLRREIMRTTIQAERNIRLWSNQVTEDKANMEKSLESRATTANTAKTMMYATIKKIDEYKTKYDADNALMERLQAYGFVDDRHLLRELAKNEVQTDLLNRSIRETRTYADLAISEVIKIEEEIMKEKLPNHLEVVDILRVLKVAIDGIKERMTEMEEKSTESIRTMAREVNQLRDAFLTGAGASINDDRKDDDDRRSRADTSPDDNSSVRSTSTRRSPSPQRSDTTQKSRSSRRSFSSVHSSQERRRPKAPPSPKRPRSRQSTRGSPMPKRRQPSPSEKNNRVIYPGDYVTKKAKNDCAFCGLNHYSDSCGAVVDPMDREDALHKNGRCRKCLSPPQFRCGSKCGTETCRYCHIASDHHYSICSFTGVTFRRPMDYRPADNAPPRRSPSPDYRRRQSNDEYFYRRDDGPSTSRGYDEHRRRRDDSRDHPRRRDESHDERRHKTSRDRRN
ncbi:unnamed protein product [Caenorhabditis nigoni]